MRSVRSTSVLFSAASAVAVLQTPKEFFDALLVGAVSLLAPRRKMLGLCSRETIHMCPPAQGGLSTASERLTLASLYVGIGSGREAELLRGIEAAVADESRPKLQIHLLMDALRGSRPAPDGNGQQQSSCSYLALMSCISAMTIRDMAGELSNSAKAVAHLLGPRMRVSLFHTPALRGLLKR